MYWQARRRYYLILMHLLIRDLIFLNHEICYMHIYTFLYEKQTRDTQVLRNFILCLLIKVYQRSYNTMHFKSDDMKHALNYKICIQITTFDSIVQGYLFIGWKLHGEIDLFHNYKICLQNCTDIFTCHNVACRILHASLY
jgi:hypothetical protein